jgi:XTP/dITP diphosphohydrolase
MNDKYTQTLQRLVNIINELREKCPWDRKQTFDSLRHLTIEETYELSEAIIQQDLVALKEELGDVMLHVVFYAKIAEEQKAFDLAAVIDQLCDKLVARHPHVFGDIKADDEIAVKRNWELLKLEEKNNKNDNVSLLAGIPQALPALLKAVRIQEKVSSVGFDFQTPADAWHKVEEELAELKCHLATDHSVSSAQESAAEIEWGDLLFSLVNYARLVKINPETALEKTNQKFMKRFRYLEAAAQRDGKSLFTMSLEEMDAYWEAAKLIDE